MPAHSGLHQHTSAPASAVSCSTAIGSRLLPMLLLWSHPGRQLVLSLPPPWAWSQEAQQHVQNTDGGGC